MFEQKTGLTGYYTLEITKNDGRKIVHHFKNLITDNGLLQFAKGKPFVDKVWLTDVGGSPITTSSRLGTTSYVHKTILETRCANVYNLRASQEKPYISFTTKVDFDATRILKSVNAVGVTFGGNNEVFSISHIKDVNGAPTTIDIGDEDTVMLTYELRVQIDTAPVVIRNVDMGKFGLMDVTIRPIEFSVPPVLDDVRTGFKVKPDRTNGIRRPTEATTMIDFYRNVSYRDYSGQPNGKIATSTEVFDYTVDTEATRESNGRIVSKINVAIAKDSVNNIGQYNAISFRTTYGTYLLSFSKLLEKTNRNKYDLSFKIAFEVTRGV